MYLFPGMELPIGPEAHGDEAEHGEQLEESWVPNGKPSGLFSRQLNNFRLYGTLFLILEVLIVAMGVKFVQLMAPVS